VKTGAKMKTTSLFGLLQKFTTQIFAKQKLWKAGQKHLSHLTNQM
jgi:hypothetical protein